MTVIWHNKRFKTLASAKKWDKTNKAKKLRTLAKKYKPHSEMRRHYLKYAREVES